MAQFFSQIPLRTKRWRSVILGLLTFLFVLISSAACTSSTNSSTNVASPKTECHIIQHIKGETCVPNNPQRVVMLGGLDDALSL
ncbi:MAG: ABC transporter substrate-binding protein [Leptolyngbyaceae cyanobacterium RM1_406_9]|nr:ABC transporter substrate-binding protein [Leptolyngbyaceae cyanobacterium RM1_406_9]